MEFINLSNGFDCPHAGELNVATRLTRIQSTWAEQKRWGDMLLTAGPELYYYVAQGHPCTVHDQSERERETRACWQGLSWIRFACQYAWTGRLRYSVVRNQCNVTNYWYKTWLELPSAPVSFVRYFKKYYTGGPIRLESCYGTDPRPPAACVQADHEDDRGRTAGSLSNHADRGDSRAA